MILGVIPARGGSKRFPGKNLADFKGRPLIAWTILEAQKSCIDALVVSTDDIEIELTSIAYGCPVMIRPLILALDDVRSEDVLRHAIGAFSHEYVVLLQPTSPLRTAEDIDECVRISTHRHEPVVSYCGDKKNGAVYVAPAQWLLAHDFSEPHIHYQMPKERSLDIDYPKDIDDFLSGNSQT